MNYSSRRPRELLWLPKFVLVSEWAIPVLFVAWGALFYALVQVGLLPLATLWGPVRIEGNWVSALLQATTFAIGFWALVRAAVLLARVRVEHDFASTVLRRCVEETREIRSGQRQPIAVESVPELWPQNPARDRLESFNLFLALHVDGLDRQFGSREVLIDNAGSHMLAWLDGVREMRRAALHFGILGTFAGLWFGLPQLVKLGDNTFDETAFRTLFEALGTCFATSVTGLLVSFVVTMAERQVAGRSTELLRMLEGASRELSVVVRNAVHRNPTVRTLEEVAQLLDVLTRKVEEQTKRIELQTETMSAGMARLQLARDAVESLVTGVGQIRQAVVAECQKILETLDPKHFERHMQDRFGVIEKSLALKVGAGVETGMKALGTSAEALSRASSALGASQVSLGTGTEALRSQVEVTRAERSMIEQGLRRITEQVAESARVGLERASEGIAKEAAAAREAVQLLQQERQRLTEAQTDAARQLAEAARGFAREGSAAWQTVAQHRAEVSALDERLTVIEITPQKRRWDWLGRLFAGRRTGHAHVVGHSPSTAVTTGVGAASQESATDEVAGR